MNAADQEHHSKRFDDGHLEYELESVGGLEFGGRGVRERGGLES